MESRFFLCSHTFSLFTGRLLEQDHYLNISVSIVSGVSITL